jgi:hypothetical protein
MPDHIRRIYPSKLVPRPVEQYQPPPPRSTRQNPSTWSNPHRLTRRLLRRTYLRLWKSLPWVRPKGNGRVTWETCSFEETGIDAVESKQGTRIRKDKRKEGTARMLLAPDGRAVDSHWL